MRKINRDHYNRILDANFNRAKEGIRVCEDICRFILNNSAVTKEYKKIRHELEKNLFSFDFREIIRARNIERDVGRGSLESEMKRNDIKDIFYANSQRAKESIRVLEEFAKLKNQQSARGLKKIRYQIYAVEKKVLERI